VQLQTACGISSYRLLVHPRTYSPARDHQGRYSDLPVAPGVGEAVRPGGMPGTA
jgi:hypothetical protein